MDPSQQKQLPEPGDDPEVLAKAIAKLSEAVTRLRRSGLNEDALVILLHHETKLSQKAIRLLLQTMADLARKYTEKPKA